MTLRDAVQTALTTSALGFVVAAMVFGAWPGIDLAVSQHYAAPEGGFPASSVRWIETLRLRLWDVSNIVALFAFLMLVLTTLFRSVRRIATRVWGFIVLSYLLGPGLLTHELLKNHWGRARPRDVIEFGGDLMFTPALTASDQCLRNCSFVSGEVSGTTTTALVLTLAFLPGIASLAGRWITAGLLWGAVLVVMWIRVVMGGHFLSDTVFAVLFMAILVTGLFRAMALDRHLAGATPANVGRDVVSIGTAIRDLARRATKRGGRAP